MDWLFVDVKQSAFTGKCMGSDKTVGIVSAAYSL